MAGRRRSTRPGDHERRVRIGRLDAGVTLIAGRVHRRGGTP
jgi:hypothetical protein